jgi:hypothetical protein
MTSGIFQAAMKATSYACHVPIHTARRYLPTDILREIFQNGTLSMTSRVNPRHAYSRLLTVSHAKSSMFDALKVTITNTKYPVIETACHQRLVTIPQNQFNQPEI